LWWAAWSRAKSLTLREFVVRVLDFANHGPQAVVVFITVINGIAEELFFRGALYTALARPIPPWCQRPST